MGGMRVIKASSKGRTKGEFDRVAREVRLAALKGIEALPGPTQVALVYSLLYDSDTRVRAVARKELLTLPFETLKSFAEGGGHPKVLDFLIRNLPKDSPRLAPLLSAPNLAHRTMEYIKTAGISAPTPESSQKAPPPAPDLEDKSALDVDLEWAPGSGEFDLPEGVEFEMPVVGEERDDAAIPHVEGKLGDTSPALPLKPVAGRGDETKGEPRVRFGKEKIPESERLQEPPSPPASGAALSQEETQVLFKGKAPAPIPKQGPSATPSPTGDGDMTYYGDLPAADVSRPPAAKKAPPPSAPSGDEDGEPVESPCKGAVVSPTPPPGPPVPRPEIRENGVLFPVAGAPADSPSAGKSAAKTLGKRTADKGRVKAKKSSRLKSFSSGMLIGLLVAVIALASWISMDHFVPDWKTRVASWYDGLPSLSGLFKGDEPQPAPKATPPPAPPPAPVAPAKPLTIELGKYTSSGKLKRAQRKAEALGLTTAYTKKQEKKITWGVSCGAAGTRETAASRARGIQSLGIPASVSGKNGRFYLYCGTLSSESSAKKRAIALRASGYPASVRKRESKKYTYALRAVEVPADKKDEIMEQLKKKGFKPKAI